MRLSNFQRKKKEEEKKREGTELSTERRRITLIPLEDLAGGGQPFGSFYWRWTILVFKNGNPCFWNHVRKGKRKVFLSPGAFHRALMGRSFSGWSFVRRTRRELSPYLPFSWGGTLETRSEKDGGGRRTDFTFGS